MQTLKEKLQIAAAKRELLRRSFLLKLYQGEVKK